MNPEASPALDVPRVTLPDVDPALRDALTEERAFTVRNRVLFSIAMIATGRRAYANTVPAHVIARRRARNAVAKASRKTNRGSK